MKFPYFELKNYIHKHFKPEIHNLATSHFEAPDIELDYPTDLNFAYKLEELKQIVADEHNVSLDHVLITNGASEACFLLSAIFLDENKTCMVEKPGYPPHMQLPLGFNSNIVYLERNPSDNFKINLDTIKQNPIPDLAFLTNLHNPSGVLESSETLGEIASLFSNADSIVIIDEIFRLFTDAPTLAGTPGTAIVNSLSKCFGGGASRIGWIVSDPDIIARCSDLKDWTNPEISLVGQSAGIALLKDQSSRLQLARSRIEEHQQIIKEVCERHGFTWYDSHSVTAFPKIPLDNEVDFCNKLLDGGILVSPGRFFGYPGHIRVGWGTTSDTFYPAVEAFDSALSKFLSD